MSTWIKYVIIYVINKRDICKEIQEDIWRERFPLQLSIKGEDLSRFGVNETRQ